MIAPDKIGHAVTGALVALIALAFTGSQIMAVLAAVFAGVAKEAWDATGRVTADPLDFAATALGGAVVALVVSTGQQVMPSAAG